MAWAKSYGKGRVFYSSLSCQRNVGHARRAADVEAMKWSLGLTDIEPAPHAMRGSAAPRRHAAVAAAPSNRRSPLHSGVSRRQPPRSSQGRSASAGRPSFCWSGAARPP